MAEITVEKKICPTCGVDVRPQALFCYNCGGAVKKVNSVPEKKNGAGKITDAPVVEQVDKNFVEQRKIVETTVENQTKETELKERASAKSSNIQEEAKLKSAAAMRRKAKSFQKQEIEVVWEEPENDSGVKLLLVGALLTIFAAVVVLWALIMK